MKPLSRQRRYQLAHKAAGLCSQCPHPSIPGSLYCLDHMIKVRERQRSLKGCKRRYRSKSYRLEAQ